MTKSGKGDVPGSLGRAYEREIKMIKNERKVQNASIKMFGNTWKHPALKPYNGKTVSVWPRLNDDHQTELTVTDGEAVICVIRQ